MSTVDIAEGRRLLAAADLTALLQARDDDTSVRRYTAQVIAFVNKHGYTIAEALLAGVAPTLLEAAEKLLAVIDEDPPRGPEPTKAEVDFWWQQHNLRWSQAVEALRRALLEGAKREGAPDLDVDKAIEAGASLFGDPATAMTVDPAIEGWGPIRNPIRLSGSEPVDREAETTEMARRLEYEFPSDANSLYDAGLRVAPDLDVAALGNAITDHRTAFWANEPCNESCAPDISERYARLREAPDGR